jgi:hypothetical protein
MKDINKQLRKAYYDALQGITYNSQPVPVHYNEIPTDDYPEFYIVFSGINSTDNSTKHSSDTSTNIQVGIYTQKDVSNTGDAADVIAEQVFANIYPNPDFRLTVAGAQVLNTQLVTDRTTEVSMSNQLKLVDRILVFSHRIYHN